MILKKSYDAWLSLSLTHFQDLERFLEETEALWVTNLDTYEDKGNEIKDEESREEFFDYHYDELVIYRDDFPRIARYSVFVSCFSYFEKLCLEYYNRALRLNTTLEKYQSDKLLHARDYVIWFRKNFGKAIFSKQIIHMFDEMNQVRNRIVHSNGKVDLNKHKGIVQIIENSSLIELNNLNEIHLSKGYISEVTRVLSELITIMHNCVYNK